LKINVRYSDGEIDRGRDREGILIARGEKLTRQNVQTSLNKSWLLFPRVYLEEIC